MQTSVFYFSYNVLTVACNTKPTLLWESKLLSTLVTWAWEACDERNKKKQFATTWCVPRGGNYVCGMILLAVQIKALYNARSYLSKMRRLILNKFCSLSLFFVLRNLFQMLEMVQVNRTVNDHQHIQAIQEKSVICNCSSEVGKLWEELSKNRLDMQSMQQELQMLQTPVKQNEPGKYFFIGTVL